MRTRRLRDIRAAGLVVLIGLTSSGCGSDDDSGDASPSVPDDPVSTVVLLDFENLVENAFVDGQDNWRDEAGGGRAVVSLDGTTANGTRMLEPLLETALNAPVVLSRRNDAVFSFAAFEPVEDDHYLQFDLTGDGLALMGLGQDADGDGILSPAAGETGPRFGIVDGAFELRGTSDVLPRRVALDPGDALADWYRLRLRLRLSDGGVSGTVLYRNLTDRDSEFREVGGLRGIDLGLDGEGASVPAATWDAVFLQLRSDGGRTPGVDNVLPHGVPTR